MGIFHKAKHKLEDVVDEHGDKISDGIDKAAGFVEGKTGHQYDDKIAQGVDQAKHALDGLDGRADGDV